MSDKKVSTQDTSRLIHSTYRWDTGWREQEAFCRKKWQATSDTLHLGLGYTCLLVAPGGGHCFTGVNRKSLLLWNSLPLVTFSFFSTITRNYIITLIYDVGVELSLLWISEWSFNPLTHLWVCDPQFEALKDITGQSGFHWTQFHCYRLRERWEELLNWRYAPSVSAMNFSFSLKLVKSESTKCKEVKTG